MRKAAGGDGSLVLIEGPPGIGKSRLLQAAREQAPAAGLGVLAARGGELERDFPHGVARQLLERPLLSSSPRERDGLLAGAAAMAAAALGLAERELPPAPGDADFAVVHGLYWLVCNLAERGPLLIAVDDGHWADEPSLRMLHYLARRLEGLAVALVLAARAHEPGAEVALLGDMAADPEVTVLRPATLSRAGAELVIATEFEAQPSDRFVDACHAASGGNPFFLRELIAALRADSIAPDNAGADQVSMIGPRRVSHAVSTRLRRLRPEAASFARAVAVLGDEVELRHAAALAGLEPPDAAQLADDLGEIEILKPGRPLRFVHPVILESVRGEMGVAELSAMHGTAARLLAQAGAPPDQVAAHLLATDPLGEAWVSTTLRAAARLARARGATDTAQRWLRRALAEGDCENRIQLLFELGEAEWLASEDPVAAIEHLREAYALATEVEQIAAIALTLGRACASVGDVEGATALLADATKRCADAPLETRMQLEAEWSSWGLLTTSAAQFAGERLERHQELAGQDRSELLLLCNLAAWRWVSGSPTAAPIVRRAFADDRLFDAGGADLIPVLEAMWILGFADLHSEARTAMDKALADARARGAKFAFVCTAGLLALLSWLAGDVRGCEENARMALGPEPTPPFAHPSIHAYLALALVERGELDEAEQVIEASWVGPHLPLLIQMNHAFYARGRLRKAQKRYDDALADFYEQGARDAQCHCRNPYLPWRLDAAECLIALDRRSEAKALVQDQLAAARLFEARSAIGAAMHAEAMLESGATRIGSLERAVAELAASPARLTRASALIDLGVSLRAAGRRQEATGRLREGLQLAYACGATALTTRAHDELRVLGARPRRMMFSGIEALTASERRVAKMAAEGLTNRQIAQALYVTMKSVEAHLSSAYRKLGIGSREELPAILGSEVASESQAAVS